MFLLDAAVIVGGLLVLTKVSDLLLRPHQQRRLQALVESATLRLSYSSVIGAARRLARSHFWRLVLLLMLVVPLQLYLTRSMVAALLQSRPGLTAEQAGQIVVLIFVGELIATIPAALVARWVLRDDSARRTALRLATLAVVLVIVTQGAEYVLLQDPQVASRTVGRVVGVLYYAVGSVGSTLFLAGLVLVLALAAHVVLRLIEAVAWRVVEYQRGAWAAVVAIATAVLGLVDLYLK